MRALACAAAVAAFVGLTLPALAQNAGETLIFQRIAAVYGSSFTDLESLVRQMREAGMGWGEIIMVLQLAALSGRSVDDIRALRAQGLGYGDIARQLGIDPAELGKAVAAVMSEGRSAAGLERAASARERARGRP